MFWLRDKKIFFLYALLTEGLVNIRKNVENQISLKHKQVDFTPILSLLHVVLSSVIQFD